MSAEKSSQTSLDVEPPVIRMPGFGRPTTAAPKSGRARGAPNITDDGKKLSQTTPRGPLTNEIVHTYWQTKAAEAGDRPDVTIRDQHYLELEIGKIASYLRSSDHVLDVGCGTGITTLRYAQQCAQITGVDFSANMVAAARQRLTLKYPDLASRVRYEVGDARKLAFESGTFSRVVSQRCLINIPERAQQYEAVREYARVLAPGGLLLMSEVTLQGHASVNTHRTAAGLEKLKVHWHNTYVDEPELLARIGDVFDVAETIRFGTYGYLSKVVLPLLVAPQEPRFDHPLNKIAAQLAEKMPNFGDCIHHVIFVLRKR